jgi:hypothetical protein
MCSQFIVGEYKILINMQKLTRGAFIEGMKNSGK